MESIPKQASQCRVLLITTGFPPAAGGIATWSANIAEILSRAGYSVTVLTTVGADRGWGRDQRSIIRVPRRLAAKFIRVIPLVLISLVLCLRSRPERVVSMTWKHEGIVGYFLRRTLRIDYVVVAHGSELLESFGNPLRNVLMRIILGSATQIIANSDYTRHLLLGYRVAPERIVVINPLPPMMPSVPDLPIQEVQERYGLGGKRIILTVGNLVRRKGHEQVIRALSDLAVRYSNILYVIVGDGPRRRELQGFAEQCGVARSVLFLGRVPAEAMDGLYRLCEIFVLPAFRDNTDVEGFGIVFVEAALRARPVIAGKSGGVPEAVLDGLTGLLVEPGNTASLISALNNLLGNAELRRRLGTAGLRRANEQLNSERQITQVLSALRVRRDGTARQGHTVLQEHEGERPFGP